MYRLICKETVEEKILQRANQKNTVQQLVMTGKHVQGDLLKQEDVVSLLLDDNQLEQKLKEISIQVVILFYISVTLLSSIIHCIMLHVCGYIFSFHQVISSMIN